MYVCKCVWAYIMCDWKQFWSAAKNAMNLKWSFFTFASVIDVLWLSAPFFDDPPPFGRFTFLFLLQFFGGLFSQQQLQSVRRNNYSRPKQKNKKHQKSNSTPTTKPHSTPGLSILPVAFGYTPVTYTEFLLPIRSHESLLGLLCLGRFFHTFAHFGPFAVDFRLFRLLSLHEK